MLRLQNSRSRLQRLWDQALNLRATKLCYVASHTLKQQVEGDNDKKSSKLLHVTSIKCNWIKHAYCLRVELCCAIKIILNFWRSNETFRNKDRSNGEGDDRGRSAEVAWGCPVAEVVLAGARAGLALAVGLQRRHSAAPHRREIWHGEKMFSFEIQVGSLW